MAACGLNGAKESSGMKYGRVMRDGYVKPNESKLRSVETVPPDVSDESLTVPPDGSDVLLNRSPLMSRTID